jgi:DNA-binding beta-propeller fold protein YncE
MQGKSLRWFGPAWALSVAGILLLLPIANATPVPTSSQVQTTTGIHKIKVCNIAVGGSPGYDPVNDWLYFPNGFGSVLVLQAPCTVVGTIQMSGDHPTAAAFDPANNEMYVSDTTAGAVSVISGLHIRHTIVLPGELGLGAPMELLWDPAANMMLLSVFGGIPGDSSVVGITGTTVRGATSVGIAANGMAYDPYRNEVLVANLESNNVTGLSAAHPFTGPHLNIPVGGNPASIAYDPADHDDYVLDSGSNNVSVINGAGKELGSIPIDTQSYGSYSTGIGWSQSQLAIYAVNGYSNTVSIVKQMKVVETVRGIDFPTGVVYDDQTGRMYVTGSYSVVYILS